MNPVRLRLVRVTISAEATAGLRSAYLSLGANLGDAVATLEQAIDVIRTSENLRLVAVSKFYRTAPFEAEGPDFCNAVIEVQTSLTPEEVLRQCLAIEQQFGRVRSIKNAPRTLDIDLIAVEGVRSESTALTLPHPRAHQRAFVLVPLCELNPNVMLGNTPQESARAADWLNCLEQDGAQGISRWSRT